MTHKSLLKMKTNFSYSLIQGTCNLCCNSNEYFMTHRNSKNQLEIQTGVVFELRLIYNQVLNVQVGSNQFGIIFSSHVTFPQIFYNLPRDSHGMNKHVATNTHLSKYMFLDDSAIILNWNNFSNLWEIFMDQLSETWTAFPSGNLVMYRG